MKGSINPKPQTGFDKSLDIMSSGKPLLGLGFTIIGVLNRIASDELADFLTRMGANVSEKIDTNSTALIVGTNLESGIEVSSHSEYQTAKELGKPIYTEVELDLYLFEKTGVRILDATVTFPQTLFNQKKSLKTNRDLLWIDKYAPTDIQDIIGNQQPIRSLMTWLLNWENSIQDGHQNTAKRGCLISGSTGIGKTTAARLIAKMMGYVVIEQNASNMRNKKALEEHLTHLTDNTLINFSGNGERNNRKFLIIMDEIDGMSSTDRGGSQVLLNAIKNTKVPIICICNDKFHLKIRSLLKYCLDLKFHQPSKLIISKRLREISQKEDLDVDNQSLEYLCEGFQNDIRQMMNYLQLYSRRSKSLTINEVMESLPTSNKDRVVMLNNFEAAKILLNEKDSQNLSLREKMNLFFSDHELFPLLIQENYLPNSPLNTHLELESIAVAADFLSDGDILSRCMQKSGDWSLLPNYAILSAIFPSEAINRSIPFPRFPEYLGKCSTQRKRKGEVRELTTFTNQKLMGTASDMLFHYGKGLLDLLQFQFQLPIDEKSQVASVIRIMDYYNLSPELLKENLPNIQYPPCPDALAGVDSSTKALLTQMYHQNHKSSIRSSRDKTTERDEED